MRELELWLDEVCDWQETEFFALFTHPTGVYVEIQFCEHALFEQVVVVT